MNYERAIEALKKIIEVYFEHGQEDGREPYCVAADIVDDANISLDELESFGFHEIVEAYLKGEDDE